LGSTPARRAPPLDRLIAPVPARRVAAFAFVYWAGVFAFGFILGTVRVLWLAPMLGESAAVLAELPVMLGVSWLWARSLLHRLPLPSAGAALAAGALAFALLLGAELALGVLAFGQSPSAWSADLLRPPGVYGLVGQIAFALMPWAVRR
jgi:hypothetical protein